MASSRKTRVRISAPDLSYPDGVPTWLRQLKQHRDVHERCSELTSLVSSYSGSRDEQRELLSYLPNILVDVFGGDGTANKGGWIDDCVTEKDTDAIMKLLTPKSPLLTAITDLRADRIEFEFPVPRLPSVTQQLLARGDLVHLPKLYANKFTGAATGKMPKVVRLDIFEFFFFCFAYFVTVMHTNTPAILQKSRTYSRALLTENYKINVCANLLTEYLREYVPNQGSGSGSGAGSSTSMLDGSVAIGDRSLYGSGPGAFGRFQGTQAAADVVVRVCVEFWLKQNSYYNVDEYDLTHDYLPPTGNTITMLTVLVYHANGNPAIRDECAAATDSTGNKPVVLRSLQDIQAPLYHFLRLAFHRMPFENDPSKLKSVVKLWLNYLLPWSCASRGAEYTDIWQPFVIHNFAFYSVLLLDFLRLVVARTPEDSDVALITRVLNAYTDPLIRTLREAERMTLSPEVYASASAVLSAHSPLLSANHGPKIRNHFLALETRNWSPPAVFAVDKQGHDTAVQLIHVLQLAKNDIGDNVVGTRKSWYGGRGSQSRRSQQRSPEDRRKDIDDVVSRLREVFRIPGEEVLSPSRSMAAFEGPPDTMNSTLSPAGVRQIREGRRRCTNLRGVPVFGSPNALPITGLENATLARLSLQLSTTLDRWCGLPAPHSSLAPRVRVPLELCDRLNGMFGVAVANKALVRNGAGELVDPGVRFNLRFLASYRLYFLLLCVGFLLWFMRVIVL